jgi:hypothetical protein
MRSGLLNPPRGSADYFRPIADRLLDRLMHMDQQQGRVSANSSAVYTHRVNIHPKIDTMGTLIERKMYTRLWRTRCSKWRHWAKKTLENISINLLLHILHDLRQVEDALTPIYIKFSTVNIEFRKANIRFQRRLVSLLYCIVETCSND